MHIQIKERLLNEQAEEEMEEQAEEEIGENRGLQIVVSAKERQPVSFIPPESSTYLADKKAKSQPSTSAQREIKKLTDGTPINPTELGLGLHAYDPNKYKNLNRKSIGEEIRKGTI